MPVPVARELSTDRRGMALGLMVIAIHVSLLFGSLLGVPVWDWLRVPDLTPVFADMRTISGALQSMADGQDPYLSNPGDPWGRQLNYPPVWVWLFEALGISQEARYRAFVLGALASFLLATLMFIRRFPGICVVLGFLSSATLLLIERGNNDVILFVIVYMACLVPGLFFAGVLLAGALKLFPVVMAYEWLRLRRWGLGLLALFAFAAYVAWIWPVPEKIVQATPVSGHLSYGLKSLAVYLDELHLAAWLWPCALVAALASLLLARRLDVAPGDPLESRLFYVGASIYCATFLAASNFDYRLIFLVLCIPALLSGRLQHGRVVVAAILLAMNYLWLKKAMGEAGIFLNHLCKIVVFVYTLGLFVGCPGDSFPAWLGR